MPIDARTSGGVYKVVSKILTADGSEIGKVVDSTGRIIYEASRLITVTGVPPISFTKSIGKPLVSWDLLGNAQQTGTPSHDNIIMPTFCGVRTENLTSQVDITTKNPNHNLNTSSGIVRALKALTPGAQYTISWKFTSTSTSGVRNEIRLYSGSQSLNVHIGNGDTFSLTAEVISDLTAVIAYFGNAGGTMADFMLNAGSTALPYEPSGYKIPITNAGQTVPVYLGQTRTVRRVKKLVLKGTVSDGNTAITAQGIIYITPVATLKSTANGYCTHYKFVNQSQGSSMPLNSFTTSGGAGTSLWFKTEFDNVADFKAYLAAQYAAGTPVTVWYVLAEPETAIVNEPLAKIGDYADELHSTDAGVTIPTTQGNNTLTVDTDLLPSNMTIVYKGKH